MPLYEYVCRKCQGEFELLIRGDETPECPKCGGRKLEKLLSVAAAHVSGSRALPVCGMAPRQACGQPECGMGRCALE
jgi:putative FmdB family regulatory protein